MLSAMVILLAALLVWRECGDNRRILALGVFGTLLSYIAVIYISDLQIICLPIFTIAIMRTLEPADSYIMHYIEEEFGYTEAIDGRYVRFYKR